MPCVMDGLWCFYNADFRLRGASLVAGRGPDPEAMAGQSTRIPLSHRLYHKVHDLNVSHSHQPGRPFKAMVDFGAFMLEMSRARA